jgi:O-antigen ligase
MNELKTVNSSKVKALLASIFLVLSYTSVSGLRLVILFPFLVFFMIPFSTKVRLSFNYSLIIFLMIIFTLFTYQLFNELSGFNGVFQVIIFFSFSYWYLLSKRSDINSDLIFFLKGLYVLAALSLALFVIFQFVLFYFFNLEVFRVEFYRERVAFSAIWSDFSILSLFLVSAIPLVRSNFEGVATKILIIFLLFIGSLFTTARTGLYSLAIFLILASTLLILRVFFKKRFKIYTLIIVLLLFCAIFLVVYLFNTFPTFRLFSLDGSSRIENYLFALNYVADNPFFGTVGNLHEYIAVYRVLPHNMILHVWVQGGLFLLSLTIIWIFSVFYSARKHPDLTASIIVSLIGLMFVPSFYSIYFFAFLSNIAFISNAVYKQNLHLV